MATCFLKGESEVVKLKDSVTSKNCRSLTGGSPCVFQQSNPYSNPFQWSIRCRRKDTEAIGMDQKSHSPPKAYAIAA